MFIDFGALFCAKLIPKSIKYVTKIDYEIYAEFDTVLCLVFLDFGVTQTPKTMIQWFYVSKTMIVEISPFPLFHVFGF